MTTLQQQISSEASATEQTFQTWDGAELFYRAWLPARPAHKAMILVHRGHEHSGRWQEFVESLDLPDTAVFALDLRGHGRSPGERGYAENFSDHVRDLDAFAKHVCPQYDVPMENIVAVGHSVGAVVLAAWVHDYAPPIRGMVLATPALRVKLYVPFARAGLAALQAVKGKSFIRSYVRPRMLTHCPNQAAAYAGDPLISRQIAVNVLLDLHNCATRLITDAAAIRTPTLLLAAGNDWVVKNSAIRKFHDRLGSRDKSLHMLEGFYHAVFHETDRQRVVELTREFVQRLFQRNEVREALIHADRDGYTRREFDALSRKRLKFAEQKMVIRTVGRLSEGIRIGLKTGFSSGQSLDHVYRNRASGTMPLGKLADRIYLNQLGWRAIRVRKSNLQTMLRKAIALNAGKQPVQIVDIASGPGRYLLETIVSLPRESVSVALRDCSLPALDKGRAIAREMELHNVTFAAGDAFDGQSLSQLRPRPDVAIVSGLYELFDRNAPVMNSLRGLAEAMRDGGYLIYTNQPWHPQLEQIARTLHHGDGSPWIMRRRTQEEMDDLVRAAGFEKTDMLIDNFGMMTVSLAKRA